MHYIRTAAYNFVEAPPGKDGGHPASSPLRAGRAMAGGRPPDRAGDGRVLARQGARGRGTAPRRRGPGAALGPLRHSRPPKIHRPSPIGVPYVKHQRIHTRDGSTGLV